MRVLSDDEGDLLADEGREVDAEVDVMGEVAVAITLALAVVVVVVVVVVIVAVVVVVATLAGVIIGDAGTGG